MGGNLTRNPDRDVGGSLNYVGGSLYFMKPEYESSQSYETLHSAEYSYEPPKGR